MGEQRFTLTDLLGEGLPDYKKLRCSVETLRKAGLISTFTTMLGAMCLALGEKVILDKFMSYLDECEGNQERALFMLRLELLETQVEQLLEEYR